MSFIKSPALVTCQPHRKAKHPQLCPEHDEVDQPTPSSEHLPHPPHPHQHFMATWVSDINLPVGFPGLGIASCKLHSSWVFPTEPSMLSLGPTWRPLWLHTPMSSAHSCGRVPWTSSLFFFFKRKQKRTNPKPETQPLPPPYFHI